jgi:NAD(P)-dependent dehydrogenase (short-subunit alcohol dehydrogenase family)
MSKGGVLVTGAARGIGAAIALELARAGYVVGCLSRSGNAPDAPATEKRAGRFVELACDVTDEQRLVHALREFVADAGTLEGLVNNAGILLTDPFAAMPTDRLRQVLETNLIAPAVLCREAYPYLKNAGRSIIVNIGSFYDRLGVKRNFAYSASKAGLAALTRSLAVEWARDGISVVTVAPGYVETDISAEFLATEAGKEFVSKRIPVGRAGDVAEVAMLIRRLVEDRLQFLTGTTIYIDGGQGISP